MVQGPREGEEFAGYRIERQLGRGGMGVVYLATHERLGRKAALKVLAPEWASQGGSQDRFVRESRLAASLDHPNIVPVYDAGERDGIAYIAMRFVEGTDLGAVIGAEPGGLDPQRALSILAQIADALDTANAAGLVHRDVKPGNILVGPPSRSGGKEWAYLTDFGLTKEQSEKSRLTKTGMFMGTLDYVAPEQIRGEALDGRTDQYALACVLFEALAGSPPFSKDLELAVLHSHLAEDPPALSSRRPDLAALDAVIAKAMAKQPADRFASSSELVETAASSLARGAPPPTVVASTPDPTVMAMPPAPTYAPAPTGPPPTGRRPKWLPWAAAAVGLALAGGAAALLLGGEEDPAGPTAGPTGTSAGPSGSGDPTFRIAYSASRNGLGEIFVVNADGTGVEQLTDDAFADASPSWSPDGTQIVFSSTRDGADTELYVMNADGSALTRLTDDAEDQLTPAWSPDGTQIAFGEFSADDGDDGIFVIEADGSGKVRLSSGLFDSSPSWSPDGTQIAFDTFVDGTGRIAVVNADGSGFQILSTGPGQDGSPAWSPDGTKIAYSRGLAEDPSNVYVMNADGSDPRRLTGDIGIDGDPAWSPDGTQIVFASTRDSASPDCQEQCLQDLYVMRADGTDVVRLFDDPASAGQPSTTAA